MRRIFIGLAVGASLMSALIPGLASAMAVRAPAQGHHWCAVYSNGSENCGFVSQAQCAASVSGGGFCRMV